MFAFGVYFRNFLSSREDKLVGGEREREKETTQQQQQKERNNEISIISVSKYWTNTLKRFLRWRKIVLCELVDAFQIRACDEHVMWGPFRQGSDEVTKVQFWRNVKECAAAVNECVSLSDKSVVGSRSRRGLSHWKQKQTTTTTKNTKIIATII